VFAFAAFDPDDDKAHVFQGPVECEVVMKDSLGGVIAKVRLHPLSWQPEDRKAKNSVH
jgi:hypothetical protein